MNPILRRQLAVDFCVSENEVDDRRNHFSVWMPLPERRVFLDSDDCVLKAAVVNGKILMSGTPEIIAECEKRFRDGNGAWFMEMNVLRQIDSLVRKAGYRVGSAHPFFIAERITASDTQGMDIRMYERDEIPRFKTDGRLGEAFLFSERPRDELGIGAFDEKGELLGMAGASSDSDSMWQIGINVMPGAEGRGIGTLLVALLKNEILRRGRLPFYGTAMSHIASQRVALGAGFVPSWTELYCERVKPEEGKRTEP